MNDRHNALFLCQCECGGQKIATGSGLRNGTIKSCGCLRKEKNIQNITGYNQSGTNITHGKTKTRLYTIWRAMKRRCYQKNATNYYRYGGRGIEVCDEWRNSFQEFYDWSQANGYDDTLTIDRIDNDKGYSPDNCRWTTQTEQVKNRSVTIMYTHNGETKPLIDWANEYNVPEHLAYKRYQMGLKHESIFREYYGLPDDIAGNQMGVYICYDPSVRIIRNRIKCVHCGVIIESKNMYGEKWCPCRSVVIDGGTSVLKRSFLNSMSDYIELAETKAIEENDTTAGVG